MGIISKRVLAIHEAAHAVASLAVDETQPIPGPCIEYITVEPSGHSLGIVEQDLRFQFTRVARGIIEFSTNSRKPDAAFARHERHQRR